MSEKAFNPELNLAEQSLSDRKVVCIVGPTGVGKSGLAIRLAQAIKGEVVNADSRQLYRYLDIGTAKVSQSEQAGVPHHLIDIIEPDEHYNLADYQLQAYNAIKAIHNRKSVPLLVGGTGQYVWATVSGWSIPRVPPNWSLRRRLELIAEQQGYMAVYSILESINPRDAAGIDSRNIRRIIRAIEVNTCNFEHRTTTARYENQPLFKVLLVGLTAERREIYRRIDCRVEKMLEKGLVQEVEMLLKQGYSTTDPGFMSVGYREVTAFIEGKLDYDEMVNRIKNETHRLVRHQNNWFKADDQRIHWFDISVNQYDEVADVIYEFLQKDIRQNGFY
ncbi:tRNA delta(2)-isopentenylpyrophosphate transferase [Dehalogenimonas lykanthroporepellens BL-DC-9]|nr:tRNA delta(2)-isopentenylpyrophosphate transferase [Dehalogenimonas lykanthroporepellens BL-DC-9]